MAAPEWSTILEVGVPEIDDDHKQMFVMAAEIGAAVTALDYAECRLAVERFLALAADHCVREEAMLKSLDYHDLDAHASYHDGLLERGEELRNASAKASSKAGMEQCYRMMMAFLVDDVVRGDLQAKSFLEEKGVAKPRLP